MAGIAPAMELLFDGDFESGTLIGWVPGAQGTAILAAKGRCFSDQDTTAISIRGRYAGLLRGSDKLKTGQSPSLTSKPFTAGKGILFLALTDWRRMLRSDHSYALTISILDMQGEELARQPLATARLKLAKGCPSVPRDTAFSEHFISTQKYLGQTIKIRFSQHADIAQYGNFSLIDQLTRVMPGEASAYTHAPLARAGIRYDEKSKHLYLTAALPAGPLDQTSDWKFSWKIDGENQPRPYYDPCINHLPPGNHHATLHVQSQDGTSSDSLQFFVPDGLDHIGAPELETNPKSSIQVCDHPHPLEKIQSTDSISAGKVDSTADRDH